MAEKRQSPSKKILHGKIFRFFVLFSLVFKVLNNRESKRDLKINSPSDGNIVTDDSVVAEIFKSTFESKVAKLKRVSSSNLAPLLHKLKEKKI